MTPPDDMTSAPVAEAPEAPPAASGEPAPTVAGAASVPPPGVGGPSPAQRPEVVVGGAFAGGFLLAMILKRLGD